MIMKFRWDFDVDLFKSYRNDFTRFANNVPSAVERHFVALWIVGTFDEATLLR